MQVAVVGAGATGLAAAFDLSANGHAVTIYESAPRVGGLASGFKNDGWAWSLERFYHHWFASDHDILGLINELGLSDHVFFRRPMTALWHHGRPRQLDSPISLLRFPGLTLLEKIRMGLVMLYLRTSNDWRSLENVTIHEWLPKVMGGKAYQKIWEPLLTGKFSDKYYREVNMAWFWARIHTRTAKLATFRGGFQTFMEALAARAAQRGAKILLNTPVRAIDPEASGKLRISSASGVSQFDCCLMTLAPRLLTRVVPSLPRHYAETLGSLQSLGAVVLILVLDRPLCDGIYWMSLPKSEFPFLVLVEHTNFVPAEHFGGEHIVYCGDYCPPGHPYFTMPPERIFELFTSALAKLNGHFRRSDVKQWWLSRETYAQPVPTVHYSRRLPGARTPITGLYVASMSHVYPWDRGTNYAVRLGRATARLMEEDMKAMAG